MTSTGDQYSGQGARAHEPAESAETVSAPFSERDKTFTDPRLCAVIADRFTIKRRLVQTGTDSYG